MIKEVLQQLEPLDAQIDALCSSTDDAEMANTTTHAAELAELSAQENVLLQRCTSLTPEDRVFLARRPDRRGHFVRYRAIPWDARYGFGAPQRNDAGRKPALQLWHAGTGRLPQGAARDEAGGKIQAAHHHIY